jgi:ParB family transcriptional regulator, chromosome partitioning protein
VSGPRPAGGLGRGLGALIPSGPVPSALLPGADGAVDTVSAPTGARFAELPLDSIRPNPVQPRTHFDEEALAELVTSIREVGLLQPVVVRPLPRAEQGAAGDGPAYELVMGERRLRAAREAGLSRLPAIVRETADDAMLRDALLENLHREQLNPLEEAAAYQQLLGDFGTTQEELAARIGRSRPQISNTIRLLNLPAPVQRRVAAGVLSAGHARALLGLPTPEAQEQLAARVVAEGLSVRSVEELVQLAQSGDQAPATRSRRPRSRRPVPAELGEVADRLADRLETRVKVDVGRSRGRVTIEFASLEDLHRIVDVIEGRPPGGLQDGEPHHDAAPQDGEPQDRHGT